MEEPIPYVTGAEPRGAALDEATINQVRSALSGITHGRVTLKVEDGRIVAVESERRTRVRRPVGILTARAHQRRVGG